MPVLNSECSLQRVIGRTADGCELVHETVVRIRATAIHKRLICITQAHQLRAFTAHVPELQGDVLYKLTLQVEIPTLRVGRDKIAWSEEDVKREWLANRGEYWSSGYSTERIG